jgi:hypothetical protein
MEVLWGSVLGVGFLFSRDRSVEEPRTAQGFKNCPIFACAESQEPDKAFGETGRCGPHREAWSQVNRRAAKGN